MTEAIFLKIRLLVQTALFAALLCILCPLAIPAGPIPVTLASFAVLLTANILGRRKAAAAALLYILMGVIGLPVFSSGQAGLGVVLGPTGGYLWGYSPMAWIAGMGCGRKLPVRLLWAATSFVLCYACGTAQYALAAGVDFKTAFAACVLPFLAFDAVKLVVACLLGGKIRSRLTAAGLLD